MKLVRNSIVLSLITLIFSVDLNAQTETEKKKEELVQIFTGRFEHEELPLETYRLKIFDQEGELVDDLIVDPAGPEFDYKKLELDKNHLLKILEERMELGFKDIQFVDIRGNRLKGVIVDEEKNVNNAKVEVYPNPNTGDIMYLRLSDFDPGNYQLQISDIQGKILRTEVLAMDKEYGIKEIKGMSLLKTGIYLVRISGNSLIREFKYILQ